MPTTRALTTRLLATAATASLITVALPATPAQAASWQTLTRVHGAALQACQEPATDGRVRVRVRIDNRNASHVHVGGVSAQGRERNLRAQPGQLTNAASLVVGRFVRVSIGIGDTNGQGAGDVRAGSSLRRC